MTTKATPKLPPKADIPSQLPATRPAPEVLPATPSGGRNPMPMAGGRPQYWCSFDPSTPEGKRTLQACLAEPIFNSEEWLRRPIEVEHLFGHEVELVDPATGEVVTATRIVGVSPNGDTCACVSEGVLNSLKWIVEMEGEPPWRPALHLKLTTGKSRRGFRYFRLVLEPPLATK